MEYKAPVILPQAFTNSVVNVLFRLLLRKYVEVEVHLRPTVSRPVRLGPGTHLGPVTNFSLSLKFSLYSYVFVIL
jgi:hypothetical protein